MVKVSDNLKKRFRKSQRKVWQTSFNERPETQEDRDNRLRSETSNNNKRQ